MINGEITINLKEGLRSTKSKEIFFMIILEYNGLTMSDRNYFQNIKKS